MSLSLEKWPALHTERREVGKLKPSAKNARTHSPEQVEQIAASISEWGFTQPLLIDNAGTVLAGHGRLAAAKLLGLADVPVVVAKGWSKAQKKAYAIADNQLALNAGWDESLLLASFAELQEAGFDTELLGLDIDLENVFTPDLEPGQAVGQITVEKVQQAQENMEGNFAERSKQTIIQVACPHCGGTFGLNKESL